MTDTATFWQTSDGENLAELVAPSTIRDGVVIGRAPYSRYIPELWELPQGEIDGVALDMLPVWCCWKTKPPSKPGGKMGKVPVSPKTGRTGGWSVKGPDGESRCNLEFFTDATTAWQYAQDHPEIAGIGIATTREYGIAGGDPDHSRDPETGEMSDKAREILSAANTYAEVSPGQAGYRFLFIGTFGGFTGNRDDLEFYEDGRFLTITGDHVTGTPDSLEHRDLTELGRRYFPPGVAAEPKRKAAPANPAQPQLAPAPTRALDAFSLPGHVRQWIENGISDPKLDRSNCLFGAAKDLFKAGATRSEVLAILNHPGHGISAVAADHTDTAAGSVQCRRWIERYTLDKAQEQAQEERNTTTPVVASRDAQRMAEEITRRLHELLQLDPEEQADEIGKVQADAQVIERMISGSFWSGSKSKLFLLNHGQSLVQFLANDCYKFLAKTFGQVIDPKPIEESAAGMSFGGDEGSMAEEERRRKFVGSCLAVPKDVILDHLKYSNQRDAVEWRVDMFATESRLELVEDKVRIVLTHRPFEVAAAYDPEVVEDYKEHFTRFDEFLRFLVMARFAIDRKKAYLWILADSDWGKGLLIDGVLGNLNAKVETSVREIEAMFEGKPVGRAPEEFKRAFALVVNEFKTVKAEIKQLESTITLAPKHQLSASVEVFAKIFTSAESVASLVTENGIEDQFANRMSIFHERGRIDDRPIWQAKGKARYVSSLTAYAAGTMNHEIATLQAMGKVEAQTVADQWLDGFIKRNGLDTMFDRFSDTLPQVAQEFINWLHRDAVRFSGDKLIRAGALGAFYLKSANVVLDQFLEEHFDRSEIGAYRKRKTDILTHASADGKGVHNHRINSRQAKCVLLKPAD